MLAENTKWLLLRKSHKTIVQKITTTLNVSLFGESTMEKNVGVIIVESIINQSIASRDESIILLLY